MSLTKKQAIVIIGISLLIGGITKYFTENSFGGFIIFMITFFISYGTVKITNELNSIGEKDN